MESKNYIPLEKFVGEKLSEKLKANIHVRIKDDMYLYNYNRNVLVDRNDPILMKCRGLVLNAEGKVLNYPFDRFFNEFEKEKTEIDWETAVVQEKLDGSLISVWWNGEDWEITTRGSFYPNPKADLDFAELFRKHFNKFNELGKGFCWMFELITKKNRIVTWYDKEFVVLLGARDLEDLKEVNLDGLIEIKRPKTYRIKDLNGCKKLFESLSDDEEGLVVVDGNFNRIKLKQESYIKLSKIKMLKDSDVFDYVLGKTEIDAEYLAKCPEVTEFAEKIKKHWLNVKNKVIETFTEIKGSTDNRKDFAFAALKYPYSQCLFTLLDGKEIEDMKLDWERVRTWLKE